MRSWPQPYVGVLLYPHEEKAGSTPRIYTIKFTPTPLLRPKRKQRLFLEAAPLSIPIHVALSVWRQSEGLRLLTALKAPHISAAFPPMPPGDPLLAPGGFPLGARA